MRMKSDKQMTAGYALSMLHRFYTEIKESLVVYDEQDDPNKVRFRGFISFTLDNYAEVFRQLMYMISFNNCASVEKISIATCAVNYSQLLKTDSNCEEIILNYLVKRTNITHFDEELCIEDYLMAQRNLPGLYIIAEKLQKLFNENNLLETALDV